MPHILVMPPCYMLKNPASRGLAKRLLDAIYTEAVLHFQSCVTPAGMGGDIMTGRHTSLESASVYLLWLRAV